MNETRGLWRGRSTANFEETGENGEWVTGLLAYLSHDHLSAQIYDRLLQKCFEVDPLTLGECTGVPAMNDMTIFEGDIVKTEYGSEIVVGVVEYDKYSGAFILNDGVYDYMFGSDITGDECEIIGNIHDNPELLNCR
ncbi:MAG: hypothetical protein HDT42_06195 [Ruminococcaceae bacterium]|nr:hypothetical protein [Oscillospiraceae bacterium]